MYLYMTRFSLQTLAKVRIAMDDVRKQMGTHMSSVMANINRFQR